MTENYLGVVKVDVGASPHAVKGFRTISKLSNRTATKSLSLFFVLSAISYPAATTFLSRDLIYDNGEDGRDRKFTVNLNLFK